MLVDFWGQACYNQDNQAERWEGEMGRNVAWTRQKKAMPARCYEMRTAVAGDDRVAPEVLGYVRQRDRCQENL